MMESEFIDELIQQAEEKDRKLEHSQLDLILLEIRNLEVQVEQNFDTAQKKGSLLKPGH